MIWTYPYELITGITRTIIKVISIIVHSNYKVNQATHGNIQSKAMLALDFLLNGQESAFQRRTTNCLYATS